MFLCLSCRKTTLVLFVSPITIISEIWILDFLVTCLSLFFLSSENDTTGVLDHTFCVEHNAYGEIIQHELKPNGKSIPVTEENKKEYVR